MRWSVVVVVCIVMLSGCGSILDGGGASSPTPETPGNGTGTPTETESPVGDISSSAPDRPMDASEAGLPVEPRGTPVDHLDLFVRSMEAYGQDVRSARVVDDGTTVRYRFRRGPDVGAELEDVAVTFAVLVGGYDWEVDRLAGTIEGADGEPVATFGIGADVAEGTYYGEYTQREYYEHVQESIERLETDEGTATSTPAPSPQGGAGPAPTPTETDSPGASGPSTDTPSPTPEETSTPEGEPGATATPTETATQTPEPTPTETRTPTRTPTETQTPTRTATPTQTPTGTATPNQTATATTTPTTTPTGGSENGTATDDDGGSAAMATAPGHARFQRASAWALLLLVPIGTLAYLRDRVGSGED